MVRRLSMGETSSSWSSSVIVDSVRAATLDDAEAVWELLVELVVSHPPRRASFDEDFPALVADARARLLVACAGDRVVGYVTAVLRPSLYAGGPVCWVSELVVAQPARREGHGAALMTAVEQWAGHEGAAEVTLATSRADRFYEAVGYSRTAGYFKKRLVDDSRT